MYAESLQLGNFRNYERLDLELSPGVNLIYGENAQGKTNILEAVYLLGTARSYRRSKDAEMIRFGCQEAHLRMKVIRGGADSKIDMHLKKAGGKGAAVNGLPIRRTSELFDAVQLVFFAPEDLSIVKRGPSERRRFADSVLCSTSGIYLKDLTEYVKCLNQRNSLLGEISFKPSLADTLSVWDEQLSRLGRRVMEKRGEFTSEMSSLAADVHERLTGGREKLQIAYEPDADAASFSEMIFAMHERDIRRKHTGTGPHRDDWAIKVNGTDLRTYGSQGQQRTAALSLKLAEIEYIERIRGVRPILLLDDVFSELDAGRQGCLVDALKGTQTLITTTGLDEIKAKEFAADRIFRVESGEVREIKA